MLHSLCPDAITISALAPGSSLTRNVFPLDGFRSSTISPSRAALSAMASNRRRARPLWTSTVTGSPLRTAGASARMASGIIDPAFNERSGDSAHYILDASGGLLPFERTGAGLHAQRTGADRLIQRQILFGHNSLCIAR